ncbi:MAG TPA: copper resistance CopC family protein [Caulobacterales bacterium]|nr:copper resistance CopC family protein [Caulobacterales bacterium]
MRAWLFSLAAGALFALAGPAAAHAMLARANPPVGGAVAPAPTELRLQFDEPVFADMCDVTLEDAAHRAVPLSTLMTGEDDSVVVAQIRARLSPGVYHVRWRAVSRDAHTTEGAYVFHVR